MMIDKRLINLVPESKKYVFLTVLLKVLALLSNALLVFTLAKIIENKGENILIPAILIGLSLIISFLTSQFSAVTSFKSSQQVKKTLRSLIYEKLLRLGSQYQEKTPTAKIIQLAVEGVEQIEVWFGQYLPQFFYSMIAALTTFAILAFINLKMAVILLVCVPLIPMSIVMVQKIAKKILGKYMDQYAKLADNYLENLQGLTTLKIYKADQYKQEKIGQEAEHFRKVTMKVLSFQLNSIIIMDIVAYAGAGLGIAAALSSYFRGQMSVYNAFVCILLSADFFIPLRRLGSYFHTAMNGTTASKNIFALLDTPEMDLGGESLPLASASSESSSTPSAGSNAARNACLFEVKDLSYKFGERSVLNNINLTIQKGSYVAFVGKSGSGKSTSAKVLCGINRDYSGSAKILGIELNKVSVQSLYDYISYISHNDWIFKGSVRDCLLEGNPKAGEEEMWQALQKVQLEGFVKEMGGLDFQIMENANNLSGGQKQRLSIARALLHNSEVYIFDEATSNIDVESEEAILELLHQLKKEKTIIMISHRKENCQGADKIYTFEKGGLQ
ncbi:MAG: ABC transporter ATP-binding protein/permease [Treponema sp.]|nr:ABC transporter ATP-binding protein/permease [Treponema sp.]